MTEAIKISISLLPVCAFLTALVFMDSFKLVSARAVTQTIVMGALAAAICFFLNRSLLELTGLDWGLFRRYLSPIVEEIIKALYVVYLFKSRKVGFMVDGAIFGFAIGTGFALVENVYYLISLESSSILIWIVRGFGTAAMHGATTAIFGIISKSIGDRSRTESIAALAPGLILAILIHSFFNHFIFSPTVSTLIVVVVLPLLLKAVFDRSERATRKWLGTGFDADQELLHYMSTGQFSETRVGRYLESLQGRFPGTVVADMFCLLRVHTELALKAKGTMMLREAGIKVAPDEETRAKFEEIKFLEKSIGKTGKLAIMPLLYTSSRDFWQLYSIKS